MRYLSTRGGKSVSAAEAIVQGICPLGGLYVPEEFPGLTPEALLPFAHGYHTLATAVMRPYLDTAEDELFELVQKAYGTQFDDPFIAPLNKISQNESVLELWHGPTLAFKDMALQMLPYLMRDSMQKTGEEKAVYILVATSGDTGKAALAGFRDVAGTAVQVFYPHDGVSHAQWLQMVTQQGANVHVCGVKGNFDDAQTAVKQLFADKAINAEVNKLGYRLSSANSINFGRLLPQIAYYFWAYLQACRQGSLTCGQKVNFCVPTGNFGNILAGYYAMRMGLPVHRLLLASNRNNVLTDFFHSGEYNSNRPFYQSMSCSIDILISSNLERLLFEAAGRSTTQVSEWMKALVKEGRYDAGKEIAAQLGTIFIADSCDEEQTLSTIRAQYDATHYLMDAHTAVAQTMYSRYQAQTGDTTHTILLSTAHPFKFATSVLRAFEPVSENDSQNIARLHAITDCAIPEAIATLQDQPILHDKVCAIDEMPRRVLEVLA